MATSKLPLTASARHVGSALVLLASSIAVVTIETSVAVTVFSRKASRSCSAIRF